MDYSQKISERQWNLPDKGELESRREATYIDDIVQKDHIQRKLLERLDGIRTVFDGGAGSGRFSTPTPANTCNGIGTESYTGRSNANSVILRAGCMRVYSFYSRMAMSAWQQSPRIP